MSCYYFCKNNEYVRIIIIFEGKTDRVFLYTEKLFLALTNING
jgi:hypothetical protein